MKKIIYIFPPVLVVILVILFFKLNSDVNFYTEVSPSELSSLIKRKKEVVIFLKKDGCVHCEQVNSIINGYAKNNREKVYSVTINRYRNMNEIVNKYNIPGTPVILYIKDGKEQNRLIGGFSTDKFNRFVQNKDESGD